MSADKDNDDAVLNLLFGPTLGALSLLFRNGQSRYSNGAASLAVTPWGPLKVAGVEPAPLASDDFTAVVEVLRHIHETTSGIEHWGSHDDIIRPIRELEEKLRQHASAVDRLLDSKDSKKPFLSVFQQTLFLQCPRGGKSAGQFRCVNRTGKPVRSDIRSRGCIGGTSDSCYEPSLTFEPNNQWLEPEESGIVRAIVDLTTYPNASDEQIQMCADIYLDEKLSLKLFICVEVYDSDEGERRL